MADDVHVLDRAYLHRLAAHFDYQLPAALAATADIRKTVLDLTEMDDRAPQPFLRALQVITGLAAWDALDALFVAVPREITVQVDDRLTPVDVAAELWLRCPQIVEQVYAERQTRQVRSFEYFQSPHGAAPVRNFAAGDDMGSLETAMKADFGERKRGRGVRVVSFERGGALWFQIWHGEAMKWDHHWEDEEVGEVGPFRYRPVRYDVVSYDPRCGELRISARAAWQKQLYRKAFGRFLFGNVDHFPGAAKFTLEPLRRDPQAVLNCGDLPDVERITLCQLEVLLSEAHNWRHIHLADSLLACGFPALPLGARLTDAVFRFKLRGLREPRVLEIQPHNVAHFKHDRFGACIEGWMVARQIALEGRGYENDEIEAILAVA
jgi:hypothetical protein